MTYPPGAINWLASPDASVVVCDERRVRVLEIHGDTRHSGAGTTSHRQHHRQQRGIDPAVLLSGSVNRSDPAVEVFQTIVVATRHQCDSESDTEKGPHRRCITHLVAQRIALQSSREDVDPARCRSLHQHRARRHADPRSAGGRHRTSPHWYDRPPSASLRRTVASSSMSARRGASRASRSMRLRSLTDSTTSSPI